MTAPLPAAVPSASALAFANAENISLDRILRLTTTQYRRMIETGVLVESDQVELLNGYLIEKMPRNPPHDATMRALFRVIPDGWEIRCQNALELQNSQPEPDLAIVRHDVSRYRERHPTSLDTALVVEISDASLPTDLAVKSLIYSRDNIATYWVVNLPDRQVEVFSQPSENGYQTRQVFGLGTQTPMILENLTVGQIDVAELFA